MLDAASSPLISALPQYERSFQDHLSSGQAYLGAMQVSFVSLMSGRMDACREVQGYGARPLVIGLHRPICRCRSKACWWLARRLGSCKRCFSLTSMLCAGAASPGSPPGAGNERPGSSHRSRSQQCGAPLLLHLHPLQGIHDMVGSCPAHVLRKIIASGICRPGYQAQSMSHVGVQRACSKAARAQTTCLVLSA